MSERLFPYRVLYLPCQNQYNYKVFHHLVFDSLFVSLFLRKWNCIWNGWNPNSWNPQPVVYSCLRRETQVEDKAWQIFKLLARDLASNLYGKLISLFILSFNPVWTMGSGLHGCFPYTQTLISHLIITEDKEKWNQVIMHQEKRKCIPT